MASLNPGPSTLAVAVMTGSSFLTLLIPGELFAPVYRRRGLAAKNLSRTTEDSGTVVVPLVPWSIAGVFMAIMGVVALLLIDDLQATRRGSGAPAWYLSVRLPLTVLIEVAYLTALAGMG